MATAWKLLGRAVNLRRRPRISPPRADLPRIEQLQSVAFRMWIETEKELDADGVHQVRVQPFGIATFGLDLDDALVQAQDAMQSYLGSLIDRGQLIAEFDRLGVEYDAHVVRTSAANTPYIEFGNGDEPQRVEASGRALVPA